MSAATLLPETLFGQQAVRPLREADFMLDSDSLITLKYKGCMLVLFYSSNNESINLAKIWALVASQIAGPIFAAVNLNYETRVAEAFTKLHALNSPLRWAALRGIPFILVYQNGWPVGFYNGERAVQPIVDYALTLACRPDYFEIAQYPASYGVPTNVGMTGWRPYTPVRNASTDYTSETNLRGYVPGNLFDIPEPTSETPTPPPTPTTPSETSATPPPTPETEGPPITGERPAAPVSEGGV